MPKATSWTTKAYLLEAKMGKNKTILGRFRPIKKCPEIYKFWFPLIIRHLSNSLIIRIFRTEGKLF